jgi:hypothetical protein
MTEGTRGEPTDEDLCRYLNDTLREYPNLLNGLPAGYPAGLATSDRMKMMDGDRKRETGHWHLMNLPYVLYMANRPDSSDVNELGRSILRTLDSFCEKFSATSGFRKVFMPLLKGIWKHGDPEFWSVVAHAYVTLLLQTKGWVVKKFGAPLPGRLAYSNQPPKDADILLGANGGPDIYLDLVMKHRPKFRNAEEARAELVRHANNKVSSKFSQALEAGIVAFVFVVCVVSGSQINILVGEPSVLSSSTAADLGRTESVTACYYALAATRDSENQLAWKLFSKEEMAAAVPA